MEAKKKEPGNANSTGSKSNAKTNSELNLSDLTLYFKFLDNNPTARFTCDFFSCQTNKPCEPCEHYLLSELLCHKRLLNPCQATLHTTINETNWKGKKASDIKVCRALVVDIDRFIDKQEITDIIQKYEPHLVVRSSPDVSDAPAPPTKYKYHLYWKLEPGMKKEIWVEAQLGLNFTLRGDPQLSTTCHLIRVPGVPRLLKDKTTWYTPSIVYPAPENIEACTPLSFASLYERFPFIQAAAELARKQRRKNVTSVKKALGKRNGVLPKVKLEEGYRNVTLYDSCVEYIHNHRGCTEIQVQGHATLTNELFNPPLEHAEVERTARSAYEWKPEEGEERASGSATDTPSIDDLISFINSMPMSFYRSLCGEKLPSEEQFLSAATSFSHFHEVSILDRVLAKYQDYLLRMDNGDIFAFDSVTKEWKIQRPRSRPILTSFAEEAIIAFISDPNFILSASSGLEVSDVKEAIDRTYSFYKINQTAQAIMHSPKIKTEKYDIFDANPFIFKCGNGVFDLRRPTETLREPVPTDYLLCSSSIVFDSTADCPNWKRFLTQLFPNDPENILYLQEQFGYALTGLIDEQKVFFHKGGGRNGKSKVLEELARIMGGYCSIMSPDDLGKDKRLNAQSIERIMYKAEGKRVVIIDDVQSKVVINEGLLKTITSKRNRVEGKHINSHEVSNHAKFYVGINPPPTLETESEAGLRRISLLPYEEKFPANAAMSRKIDEQHEAEGSGILNWAIEGLHRMLQRGCLSDPESVNIAIAEYREENFVVEQTLKEIFALPTDAEPGEWRTASEWSEVFNKALMHKGLPEMLPSQFAQDLRYAFTGVQTKHQRGGPNKTSQKKIYLRFLGIPDPANKVFNSDEGDV